MFHKIFCIMLIVFCMKCRTLLGESFTRESSLTFVIDDTYSMHDDIVQVRNAAMLIYNTVMSSNASHIKDFVLVTFNDPDIQSAFITVNREDYLAALNAIVPHGGGDCPEMAMRGIEEALIKSRPRSYIFVFTDASATDYRDFSKIKSIAQKKSSQIIFVLTGVCSYLYENDPAYQVYPKLATTTSGQVFHLQKNEVNKILNYVKELVTSARTVLAESEFDAGYGHTVNYTTDSKTKDVIVAVSGKNPKVEVLNTNGTKTTTSNIFKNENAVVVKVTDTDSGTHTAVLGSEGKTKVIVTGATLFNFKHGFSVLKPASIEDTATRPMADKLSYLAIKTLNIDNDVELKEVNLLDMSNNVIRVLTLDKIDADLYLTEQLVPPNTMFKILVKGYDVNTKTPIQRASTTPIEPQLLMDEGVPVGKKPTISSVGENLKKVNYGDSLQLRCKVNGFPMPRITWIDEKSGATLSENVEAIDLPYDYVSVLNIDQVKTNNSYQCRAVNIHGDDKSTVAVEVNNKFIVVNVSVEDTSIPIDGEGSLYCLIDAIPPPLITWYINGVPLNEDDENIELISNKSVLNIILMQPIFEGEYTCEARNEIERKLFRMRVTIPNKAAPKIEKTLTQVKVIRNESVDISCRVIEGVPQPNVNWFFKQLNSPEFVKLSEVSDEIHITTADPNKAGIYRCEVYNFYGKDTNEIELIVKYPPAIKDDTPAIKKLKAEDGKILYLDCLADGFPTPRVVWTFNGNKIEDSFNYRIYKNNTLRYISSITNAGKYTCEAINELGSQKKSVEVLVYVSPKIKPPPETTLFKNVGSSLTLPCKASGFPKPTIKWLYINNGIQTVLRATDKSGSLHLPRLQAFQSGDYLCFAKNYGGTAKMAYSLKVLTPPTIEKSSHKKTKTAVMGDLVLELPCQATGNPKPTITWLKDYLNVPTGTDWHDIENDGTLIIKNIDEISKGTYKCIAQNKVGIDTDFIKVNVLDFPKPDIPKKTVYLELGKPAIINCEIPHKWTDVLRWYKGSKIIATGELSLKNVQLSDLGLYTCRVNTFTSGTSATISVKVGFKPMFTSYEDENVEFFLDEQAYLSCAARGEPSPKVTWKYNNKPMNVTSMIHSFVMTETNKGNYSCIVTNLYGTITRNFSFVNPGCLFDLDKRSSDSPDILPLVDLRSTHSSSNILEVPKLEKVSLTCSGGFMTFPTKIIEAICIQDTLVEINKQRFNILELKCNNDNMKPVIKQLRYACAPGNTEKLKVGYENFGEFVESYEICYNATKALPIYSTHRIKRLFTGKDSGDFTKWFESDMVPYNYDDLYNCESQIEQFKFLDKCCFEKRQFVNARDVPAGLSQIVTYSNLNVFPHWSNCNSKNWDEVEKRIRTVSKLMDRELVIHTGTAFPFEKIFLTDKHHQKQAVPRFLWKVVQDEISKSSLAIIQVNIPYLTSSEADRYIFCHDICSDTEWMKNPEWRDISKGFTYCCSVTDFEKVFGLDKIFSPGMENNLYDISLVPDHYF